MQGGRTSQVNAQGQIVQSGNYGYLSIRVASIDLIKKKQKSMKDYPDSKSNYMSKLHHPSWGKTRGASQWGCNSGPKVWKISYRTQTQLQSKIT